jgi:hypothetical protein
MLRLMLVLSTLGFLVACSPSRAARLPASPTPMIPATPTVSLAYIPHATTEIVYANLQPYAGAPRPGEECLYTIAPILRIFGDGRTGLDLRYTQSAPPWQWEGELTSQQLQTVLQGLNQQGFFTPWKSDGPNPAGTYLEFGVRLQSKTVVYISGNPDPAFYRSLVRQLLPLLHPTKHQHPVPDHCPWIEDARQ